MKNIARLLYPPLLCASLLLAGCLISSDLAQVTSAALELGGASIPAGQYNIAQAASAFLDLGTAVLLTDGEIKAMSRDMRVRGDAQANVATANSPYAQRLERLIKNHSFANGTPLNYKVYITKSVNANASADGSIRVYSGLMDLMDDDELLYVLGHEMGHVANGDVLQAMRVAYTASATRKGIGAASPATGALSESILADLLEATINAQFSQSQELAADDFAMAFLMTNGYDTQGAGRALRKLESLGSSGGTLLASHPDPGTRAARMERRALPGRPAITQEQASKESPTTQQSGTGTPAPEYAGIDSPLKNERFQQADKLLNITWAQVRNLLSAEQYRAIQVQQQEWIKSGRDNDASVYINIKQYNPVNAYTQVTFDKANELAALIRTPPINGSYEYEKNGNLKTSLNNTLLTVNIETVSGKDMCRFSGTTEITDQPAWIRFRGNPQDPALDVYMLFIQNGILVHAVSKNSWCGEGATLSGQYIVQ